MGTYGIYFTSMFIRIIDVSELAILMNSNFGS
jgi:hypothetical protein